MDQLFNPKMYACKLIYIDVQNVFLTVITEFSLTKRTMILTFLEDSRQGAYYYFRLSAPNCAFLAFKIWQAYATKNGLSNVKI